MNRRKFLSVSLMGAAGAMGLPAIALGSDSKVALGDASAGSPAAARPSAGSSGFSSELFHKHVKSTFVLTDTNGKKLKARLDAVNSMSPSLYVDQFTLQFRVPHGSEAIDGLFQVRHPKLGNFPLFLKYSQTNAKSAVIYEAAFSLLV